jgi:pyrimidine oxygenase
MIKLRGFGGKTQFWEHNLESFTLMAGLAAVTSRIKLYATAATLTLPPAIMARMAVTIDLDQSWPIWRQSRHGLAEGGI